MSISKIATPAKIFSHKMAISAWTELYSQWVMTHWK